MKESDVTEAFIEWSQTKKVPCRGGTDDLVRRLEAFRAGYNLAMKELREESDKIRHAFAEDISGLAHVAHELDREAP